MIQIAICDDEESVSQKIRKMAVDFFRGRNIDIAIQQFSGGRELLNYSGAIDVLFLDIQMEGIDGMEAARRLRSRNFKGVIIFITVLEELVFQSFEVQAYDYLVKPIEEGRFKRTMERLCLSMENASETSLLVHKGNESRIISFDDIVYCEVIDRKIYLHLKTEGIVDYYEKLDRLAAKLDRRFYRCHRSYLINIKYLKSYRKGIACLEGGVEVPVSRLRSKEFSDVILQYMKERSV